MWKKFPQTLIRLEPIIYSALVLFFSYLFVGLVGLDTSPGRRFLPPAAGIATTLLLGFWMRPFWEWTHVHLVAKEKEAFERVTNKDLYNLRSSVKRATSVLGTMERLLFLFSFAADGAAPVGAGWLLFKVAAKWESWSNIIKVPGDEKAEPPLPARNVWGTKVLSQFLVGTLANIMVGLIGAIVMKTVPDLLPTVKLPDW